MPVPVQYWVPLSVRRRAPSRKERQAGACLRRRPVPPRACTLRPAPRSRRRTRTDPRQPRTANAWPPSADVLVDRHGPQSQTVGARHGRKLHEHDTLERSGGRDRGTKRRPNRHPRWTSKNGFNRSSRRAPRSSTASASDVEPISRARASAMVVEASLSADGNANVQAPAEWAAALWTAVLWGRADPAGTSPFHCGLGFQRMRMLERGDRAFQIPAVHPPEVAVMSSSSPTMPFPG